MATAKKTTAINVMKVDQGNIYFKILGGTPLIMNSMSSKVQHELLLPKGKKTASEKASALKHEVIPEYRGSMYRCDDSAATALGLPSIMFKACLRNAALDLEGVNKTQIGRLTFVEGTMVELYGVPQMLMSVVRCADMNRTPDIRTRAILPEWACIIGVRYIKPLLREQIVVNLLAAAGLMQGVGDWRPQKGSADYGQFSLVGDDDENFKRIVGNQGRKAQEHAIEEPAFFDAETEDLYHWYTAEVKRRGFKVVE